MTVSGTRAYLACGAAGLRVVDVSTPSKPKVLSQDLDLYAYSTCARRIAFASGKAYVADEQTGLRVITLPTSRKQVQVGLYSPLGSARRLTVEGTYAYVAADLQGMRVVDVSDPSHPREVAAYDIGGGDATGITAKGDFAYLSIQPPGTPYFIHVVDISDPIHPKKASALPTCLDDVPRDIALQDQTLYVANEWGLKTVNVADPLNPAVLGYYYWPDTVYGVGVGVSGDYAYYAKSTDGVKILNVSDPANPTPVSTYLASGWVNDITIKEMTAYIACSLCGIDVVDVSDPTSPAKIASLDTPGCVESVEIENDEAYVSDGGGGVQVVDISSPASPRLIGSFDTPGYTWHVTAVGNYLYVADAKGGMLILERVEASSAPAATSVLEASPPPGSHGDGPLAAAGSNSSAIQDLQQLHGQRLQNLWQNGPQYHGRHGLHLPRTGLDKKNYPVPAVNSANPTPLTDGVSSCLVTSTADSGSGTLRTCLESTVSGGIITFDPAVFPPGSPATINPATQLPTITQGSLTIDGSNAGVILNGTATPAESWGLVVDSSTNAVKGLQVLYFPGGGMHLTQNAGKNTIGGDRNIGSGPTGEGNVISGNGSDYGLLVEGSDNVISGNLVGTDATGLAALGNAFTGAEINGARNIIGGKGAGKRNVISGNSFSGMHIGGEDNTVIGNFFGTDISGAVALTNFIGLQVFGPFNRVGGSTEEERNLISGNGFRGLQVAEWGCVISGNYIGTDVTGTKALPNDVGVAFEAGARACILGGTKAGERNVVSGNRQYGLIISDPAVKNNSVIGNYFGLGADGKTPLGNYIGMLIWTSNYNRVGGKTKAERNIISGNTAAISIGGKGSGETFILGNFIGTDVAGGAAVANEGGISINEGVRHNFVGGTSAAERNVINGNGGGVDLFNGGVEYNMILGNYLGTDVTGKKLLGNRWNGVSISDSSSRNFLQGNVIGGSVAGAYFFEGAHSNVVRANRIGIAPDGLTPLPNSNSGIIVGAPGNLVGGQGPKDGNIFAYNGQYGVCVVQHPRNTISSNSIHKNGEKGIDISSGGNNLLPSPTITGVTHTTVTGTACAGCRVEIFSDKTKEGRYYEGFTIVSASGSFSFLASGSLHGPKVTATATDDQGNTSEFSLPKKVP